MSTMSAKSKIYEEIYNYLSTTFNIIDNQEQMRKIPITFFDAKCEEHGIDSDLINEHVERKKIAKTVEDKLWEWVSRDARSDWQHETEKKSVSEWMGGVWIFHALTKEMLVDLEEENDESEGGTQLFAKILEFNKFLGEILGVKQ